MHLRSTLVAAALLLAGLPADAQDPSRALQPTKSAPLLTLDRTDEAGVVSGGRTVIVTAHVRSVDLSKREVTLHGDGGRVETLRVGPEMKNLDRIQRGDRVSIRYREGLVLRLQAPGAEDVVPEVQKKVDRTGVGDVLSGSETVRARETLAITAIDPAERVVTLQGPDAKVHKVKAGKDVALDRVKVGDRFTATYSASTVLSVEPIYRE